MPIPVPATPAEHPTRTRTSAPHAGLGFPASPTAMPVWSYSTSRCQPVSSTSTHSFHRPGRPTRCQQDTHRVRRLRRECPGTDPPAISCCSRRPSTDGLLELQTDRRPGGTTGPTGIDPAEHNTGDATPGPVTDDRRPPEPPHPLIHRSADLFVTLTNLRFGGRHRGHVRRGPSGLPRWTLHEEGPSPSGRTTASGWPVRFAGGRRSAKGAEMQIRKARRKPGG